VVTPPEPWDKLKAAGLDQKVAGFDPFAVMAGDLGYCVIEVFSVPRYSFSVACGTWQQPGVVPAHTIDGGCSNGDFVLCYASTAAHTDHFVVLPKDEGERTFRAVPSRGFSYTAFTLPAGQTPILITAYDAHGRQIASTTSL
jgi:hypothetical protein